MKRIEAGFERQRRFTCDAMIAREVYRSDASGSNDQRRVLSWKDRLHVDVAVFDGEQRFSWPGTGTFRFEGLDEMTGTGPSGTGDFGSFAASFLADSDPASVRFRGVSQWSGAAVAEYAYAVPLVSSHYTINTGQHRFERTSYLGSMFVDAQTGDAKEADYSQIPAAWFTCHTTLTSHMARWVPLIRNGGAKTTRAVKQDHGSRFRSVRIIRVFVDCDARSAALKSGGFMPRSRPGDRDSIKENRC